MKKNYEIKIKCVLFARLKIKLENVKKVKTKAKIIIIKFKEKKIK